VSLDRASVEVREVHRLPQRRRFWNGEDGVDVVLVGQMRTDRVSNRNVVISRIVSGLVADIWSQPVAWLNLIVVLAFYRHQCLLL